MRPPAESLRRLRPVAQPPRRAGCSADRVAGPCYEVKPPLADVNCLNVLPFNFQQPVLRGWV